MITLRCTKRLLDFLDAAPAETAMTNAHAQSMLGDWYANLIPTSRGPLVIFVSERTLITVAIPAESPTAVMIGFVPRVANLLAMLEIPHRVIDRVVAEINPVVIGRTRNRRILGSMNEIAWRFQVAAECAPEGPLSLSDTELKFTRIPHSPLGYRFSGELVRELLLATRRA